MAFRDLFRRREVTEAAPERAIPANAVRRSGFETGIPQGGIDEYRAGVGASTNTDRRSTLVELYEAYIACPWAWACVNAIARTITAGGMVMDWATDTGEGDQKEPDKPPAVLALERLIQFTNPRQNIRQLMRSVVVDLLVFGDAFIEVVWWGTQPVALYNLDAATTTPVADEHGNVSGYVQVTDFGQRAQFDERDVIHISLDAPRSGIFGISPTQAALVPITTWLHAAAGVKEMSRKGLPPEIHADFPAGTPDNEIKRWREGYMVRNVGPRNFGQPVTTKGGAHLAELTAGKVGELLAVKDQARDEILSDYGVPPAKAGVIESGNLGGGTGEEQDKTYKIDVCAPIGELVLEAFNFAITKNGFGIDDWNAKFREVDYRASAVIENIRDQRLRNGSYTLNRYRTEIGEPPVDGGNDAVLVDRQNLVLWSDMQAMSKAVVAGKGAPAVTAGETPPNGEPMAGGVPGDGQEDGQPPQEAVPVTILARYRQRLSEALKSMPVTEAGGGGAAKAVYSQLAGNFPPSAIAWVKDGTDWSGPKRVPVDQVDTADRDHWDASREPDQVNRMRRKLRKKLAKGEHPKPLILVKTPGSDTYLIADGHHRFLAAEAEGQEFVWAFTGKTDADHGDWDTMAMSEDRDKAA